jgi:hypothetical protein
MPYEYHPHCRAYCTQDKLHLLGWPVISTKDVTERELKSLTGEAIHLGCLGMLLASAFCDPTAPWWSAEGAATSVAAIPNSGVESATGPEPPKKKRVRRIGPVKSMT